MWRNTPGFETWFQFTNKHRLLRHKSLIDSLFVESYVILTIKEKRQVDIFFKQFLWKEETAKRKKSHEKFRLKSSQLLIETVIDGRTG